MAFFDVRSAASTGHVSPVVAVIGEDLGVALLQHYLRERCGVSSMVVYTNGVPKTPTNGTGSGSRLDRWLLTQRSETRGRVLYQVEIKNWSATAIGGREVPLDAKEEFLREVRQERWLQQWDSEQECFRYSTVGKVLDRMLIPTLMDDELGKPISIDPPVRQEEVEPMLCFWYVVHDRGENESLFSHPLPSAVNGFTQFSVFSMSNYLRSLKTSEVELEMPSATRRIDWLSRLLKSR